MTLHTGIAEALRRAGLEVVEEPGWRVRGKADFAPQGVIFHHTASAAGRDAPSLGIVIAGRPDLPGPLCQILIARSGTCHVIAAGTANHAGPGTWHGLEYNRQVLGIEVENNGVGEPWSEQLLDVTARACRAMLDMIGHDVSWLCGHKEWAPRRKIDPAGVDMDDFRRRVATLEPGDDELNELQNAMLAYVYEAIKEGRLTGKNLPGAEGAPSGELRSDVWRWSRETVLGVRALADTEALADALSAKLSGAGSAVTQSMLENALRNVLGGLDDV